MSAAPCARVLSMAFAIFIPVVGRLPGGLLRSAIRDFFERNASAPFLNASLNLSGSANRGWTTASLLAALIVIEKKVEDDLLREAGTGLTNGTVRQALARELTFINRMAKQLRDKRFQRSDPLLDRAVLRSSHLISLLTRTRAFFEGWRLLLDMFVETSSYALCPPGEVWFAELIALGGCFAGTLHVIAELLVRHRTWAFRACEAGAAAAYLIKAEDALHIFPEDTAFITDLRVAVPYSDSRINRHCGVSPFVFEETSLGCSVLDDQAIQQTAAAQAGLGSITKNGNPNVKLVAWPIEPLQVRVARALSWMDPGLEAASLSACPHLSARLPRAVESSRSEVDTGHPGDLREIDLAAAEHRFFSQSGEDGVLETIFSWIGVSHLRFYVEFGAEDGREGQGRYLRTRHGFRGALFDNRYEENLQIGLQHHNVDVHDLGTTLYMIGAPPNLDLLSVDVNGPEYIVWSGLDPDVWRPRVVCIEFDSSQGPRVDSDSQTGASIASLHRLGLSRNYSLVHLNGINAFFVRRDILDRLRRKRKISFLHADDVDALCAQPQAWSSLGYGRPGAQRCGSHVGLGWR